MQRARQRPRVNRGIVNTAAVQTVRRRVFFEFEHKNTNPGAAPASLLWEEKSG